MKTSRRLILSWLVIVGSLFPAAGIARAASPATYSWLSVPAAGSSVAGVVNLSATSSDGSAVRLALLGPDGYDQLAEKIPSGGSYPLKSYSYAQGASTFALSDGAGHYSAQVPVTVNNPFPSIASFSPGAGGAAATPGPVSVVPVEPAVTGLGIASVSYSIDGVRAGFVDQPPWQATLPDLPPGPHLLTASVFDTGDRTFSAAETITTVRATVLRRTDTPHTARSGKAHQVTFAVTEPGNDPEARPALGVTLSARPLGSTGGYAVIGYAVGDQAGIVAFPVTTKRSLELLAALDPVAGYAPASVAGSLIVTTELTCSASRGPGLAGRTAFAGSCSVSPSLSGRPLVYHLGSRHGRILHRATVRGSRFSFSGRLTTSPLTLVLVLADGSYTSGATATLRIPAYAKTPVPPTTTSGRPTRASASTTRTILLCPTGVTSGPRCTALTFS